MCRAECQGVTTLVLPSENLHAGRSGNETRDTPFHQAHKSSEASKELKINHGLIHQAKVFAQHNLYKKIGKRVIYFRQISIPNV